MKFRKRKEVVAASHAAVRKRQSRVVVEDTAMKTAPTKRTRIPMTLCGADDRTHKAFALLRTGPHVAWHLVHLFETRKDACNEAQRYVGDMHTDGLVVRPVTFGREVMRWERKR